LDILRIIGLSATFIIPAIVIGILIMRLNRNQLRKAKEMQGSGIEFESGFRHSLEAVATVISKSETIAPNAGGYAKVDLLVEVKLAGQAPYQVSTCWLVEVDSLEQVMPGRDVPIRVAPKKPQRVYPNIPWAKLWIFGG
jgi:hypothetical protein